MVKARKILSTILVLAMLSAGASSFAITTPVAADSLPIKEEPPGSEEEYVSSQIIVKFKRGIDRVRQRQLNDALGSAELYTSHRGEFNVLQIPEGKTVADMIQLYSRQTAVEYAEPNYVRRAIWNPNDSLYSFQWHFDQINLEAAWDLDTTVPNYGGDPSIVVAIIDTGVAYEDYGAYEQAPDLASTNFTAGWDFINNDAHPNDDQRHGTHVCGTIAQSTNNGSGVAGIAFNTTIMPIKVLDSGGYGSDVQVADGIYYATDNGAKIINLSLGGPGSSSTLRDAVAYAYNHGVTIICAAGNSYLEGNPLFYPAAYDDYCIAVGATRYDQNRAYYSNTGSYLDIVAPGGDVTVDQNSDGYPDGVLQQTFARGDPTDFRYYYFFQGTSMASPHVAGVAALILAEHPSWIPDQVRQALESTATDLGPAGRDDIYGWGLLNAPAAISGTPGPTEPSVATNEATDVTTSSAMLNGVLDSLGDFGSLNVSFEWGTTSGALGQETETQLMTTTGEFSAPLNDLTTETTYYFRAKATGGTTVYGDELSFTILGTGASESFFDSFEDCLINWTQDSQNDWFCSTQRAVDGNRSAEVNGGATDATLTLQNPINLSSTPDATLTFSWYIESGLDSGEYLALDLWNGSSWDTDVARLRGNIDPENTWHEETINLSSYQIPDFRIRFRGKMSSSREDANIDAVNISASDASNNPPVADAGGPYSGTIDSPIALDGSASSDDEGPIVSYTWNFGDGTPPVTLSNPTTSHTYTTADTYSITLAVEDVNGATDTDNTTAEVATEPVEPSESFFDSFEDCLINWTQDSQNDWFCSAQRAVDGNRSAEVDGGATDAALTLQNPVNLSSTPNATLTFSWYIESGLDSGEYLALDLWNGSSWDTDVARLRGNIDPENTWIEESINLSAYQISDFRIRFRGKISSSREDANIDVVRITAP